MNSHPSLLVAGGAVLGAAAAAAALIRGERISIGQKALIAAVLLAAPGYARKASRPAPPVLIPAAPAPLRSHPVAEAPDHLRRDIALRPVGHEGHMSPTRFRIVDGRLQQYALLEDGSWGLLRAAENAS